ncbi:hypothetical protein VNO77_35211 [Canavalia gladiata]|uniref:Uncharacterized protein n=1 Tax=Canavalia gladiata TaxID=3824 RepID=A0AAN9KH06_CANGL
MNSSVCRLEWRLSDDSAADSPLAIEGQESNVWGGGARFKTRQANYVGFGLGRQGASPLLVYFNLNRTAVEQLFKNVWRFVSSSNLSKYATLENGLNLVDLICKRPTTSIRLSIPTETAAKMQKLFASHYVIYPLINLEYFPRKYYAAYSHVSLVVCLVFVNLGAVARLLPCELVIRLSHRSNICYSSIVPLLKLLCLTVIRLLLANPRMQFLPKVTCKLLSKLVFALFLLCLIFTELGESITLENFVDWWWFIPVNVLVNTALGCLLGFLVLDLFVVPKMIHFWNPRNTTGVAYVSLSQWVRLSFYALLFITSWNFPWNFPWSITGLLRKALKSRKSGDIGSLRISQVFSSSTIHELKVTAEGGGNSPKSIRCLAEPRVVRRNRIIAEQTPIQHILAGAMVPFVMLGGEGGMLAEGPNEFKLGLRTAHTKCYFTQQLAT